MSEKNECLSCDCWDSDLGCTMPETSKLFACSLESSVLNDPCREDTGKGSEINGRIILERF